MSTNGTAARPALQALYEGDTERALELLPPDEALSTYEAAIFGRVERLRQLLDEDPARAGEISPDGFSPLHGAIYGGRPEAVALLLERGADPNLRSTGTIARVPPLGTAAFVRRPDLAELLLDAGADVNGEGEG